MVVGAIPIYLAAQEAQRFAAKSASLAVDLEANTLLPYRLRRGFAQSAGCRPAARSDNCRLVTTPVRRRSQGG
jgi:hypothetical protein